MKKIILVLVFLLGFGATIFAQTALDPAKTVNEQITGPGVYTVEAGQTYYFNGRLDLVWDVTIEGPAVDWIGTATNPPVLVNTPGDDGLARQFFEIDAGGMLTLKNLLMSGMNSNGAVVGTFLSNVAGNGFIADNVAFTDWQDFATRNQGIGEEISITNCVFINGVRLSYSPWGGFPLRMDVGCNTVTLENNTVFNSGRLIANSGPWFNATVHEIHCTYINQGVNGHEQRAYEMIQANNIFYNYGFLGRKYNANEYDGFFTTWNYFSDVKEKLDSVSLYLGQNLFAKQQAILDWYTASGGDTVTNTFLWEKPDVDSCITYDDNYKIGTNYSAFDPGFTNFPNVLDKQIKFMNEYWNPSLQTADWTDWRVPSPVTFDASGLPSLTNWPVDMDLSYSNTYLQKAGTDGLPLGDLNWFPAKKAEFLANKDAIVAALQDSIANATALYDPSTMDATPMITPDMVDVKSASSEIPASYSLANNYPNPFNPSTVINFSIPKVSKVTLSVYNVLGQKVASLVNKTMSAGSYQVQFDAKDLGSGIYFYTINAGNFQSTKKMMLVK